MTHTAVGLFKNLSLAEEAINDLKAAGVTTEDLHILTEPRYMHVSGVLSTPEVDFCAELERNLTAMGATEAETQAYVQGCRGGGILVFATGSEGQVEKLVEIMNRHQGTNVEELTDREEVLLGVAHESAIPARGYSTQAGRIRQGGSGARIFVW